MLRNSDCILDLAPRYMVVLHCSSPVCMATVFGELQAFDSPQLTWVVSCNFLQVKERHFICLERQGCFHKKHSCSGICQVINMTDTPPQLNEPHRQQFTAVKNELGDSWNTVPYWNTTTQDWWLCFLCEDIVKSFCVKACVDGEYVHSSQYRSRFRGQRVGRGPCHNKRPRLNVREFQSPVAALHFCPFWLIKPARKNKDASVLWPCC